MSQEKPFQRNLWSLTVLCLLRLRPMHPYEMQRLIRELSAGRFTTPSTGSGKRDGSIPVRPAVKAGGPNGRSIV